MSSSGNGNSGTPITPLNGYLTEPSPGSDTEQVTPGWGFPLQLASTHNLSRRSQLKTPGTNTDVDCTLSNWKTIPGGMTCRLAPTLESSKLSPSCPGRSTQGEIASRCRCYRGRYNWSLHSIANKKTEFAFDPGPRARREPGGGFHRSFLGSMQTSIFLR